MVIDETAAKLKVLHMKNRFIDKRNMLLKTQTCLTQRYHF